MKQRNRRNFFKKASEISLMSFLTLNLYTNKTEANIPKEKADMIVVWKSKRQMGLFFERKLLKSYRIRLGFNPIGHKQKEGDGRTPEGQYFITHHNPKSRYYLSLGISYPNNEDTKNAEQRKETPGKDIYIHGGPGNILVHFFKDWTNGCIAVLDYEMDEIYNLVPDGTVIYIYP